MGWPAYQDNWRAEEELAILEFPMIKIVVVEENRNS